MPRVYPPKKTIKPNLSTNGGTKSARMCVEKVFCIGRFDICVSEDGESLQIWKGDKLIQSFK